MVDRHSPSCFLNSDPFCTCLALFFAVPKHITSFLHVQKLKSSFMIENHGPAGRGNTPRARGHTILEVSSVGNHGAGIDAAAYANDTIYPR